MADIRRQVGLEIEVSLRSETAWFSETGLGKQSRNTMHTASAIEGLKQLADRTKAFRVENVLPQAQRQGWNYRVRIVHHSPDGDMCTRLAHTMPQQRPRITQKEPAWVNAPHIDPPPLGQHDAAPGQLLNAIWDLLGDKRPDAAGLANKILRGLRAGLEHVGPTDEDLRKAYDIANPDPRPVLTCMGDVEPCEINWLWPGRIPLGRITLLVGRPGEGKSFMTADMAARISTGRAWPDGSDCPLGSVILVSAEDDPGDTIRPRLDAHGADCRKVHILSAVRRISEDGQSHDVMFTLEDVAALEAALKQVPDCKLIVVDPIGSFLGGNTDAHRDNEVRGVLAPVARLAEQYGPAVLVVAHRRKSSSSNADETALGSRAFTGIARAVWHLSRDPDNKRRRLFLPGKNNLGPEGDGLAFTIEGNPAALIWDPDPVALSADDGLAAENNAGDGVRPGPEPEARDAAVEWLRGVLADGAVDAGEIKEQSKSAGMNYRTVQRAADVLGVQRTKGPFGCGWRWGLPQITHFNPDDTKATGATKGKEPVVLSSSVKQGENNDDLSSSTRDDKLVSLRGEPVALASDMPPDEVLAQSYEGGTE